MFSSSVLLLVCDFLLALFFRCDYILHLPTRPLYIKKENTQLECVKEGILRIEGRKVRASGSKVSKHPEETNCCVKVFQLRAASHINMVLKTKFKSGKYKKKDKRKPGKGKKKRRIKRNTARAQANSFFHASHEEPRHHFSARRTALHVQKLRLSRCTLHQSLAQTGKSENHCQ